jgi:hypothetical protein
LENVVAGGNLRLLTAGCGLYVLQIFALYRYIINLAQIFTLIALKP